jgi:thiamine-monophosphate kinase
VKLRDLGEFALIERIERAARRAGATRGPAVVLGVGDDAALLRLGPREDLAVSTDALVEEVHFRWRSEAPASIGRRAMTAALSDLAAMGARPLGVVAALAAPGALDVALVDGFVRGLATAARRHQAPLVGGNVTRSERTSIVLTSLGAVRRGRALTRSAARPGDRILVTGSLGGTALARLRGGGERGGPRRQSRIGEPRLRAGRILAGLTGVGACIDVSDGLAADLGHVLRASRVGAELDPSRLPTPPGFARACARIGVDPLRLALSGGEDYELLFTVRPGGLSSVALAHRLGLAVTEIGRITGRPGLRGLPHLPGGSGWTHF